MIFLISNFFCYQFGLKIISLLDEAIFDKDEEDNVEEGYIINETDSTEVKKVDPNQKKADPSERTREEQKAKSAPATYSNLLKYLKNVFQNAKGNKHSLFFCLNKYYNFHNKDQYDFHVVKLLYLINLFKDGEYRSLEQDHLEGKFMEVSNNIRNIKGSFTFIQKVSR